MGNFEDVSFSVVNSQHIPWNKRFVSTEGIPYSALVLRLHDFAKLKISDSEYINSKYGDVTYVPAKTAYEAEYPGEGEMIFVHFTETVPFFDKAQNFTCENLNEIKHKFIELTEVCADKKQFYKIKSAHILLEIILCLLNSKESMYRNSKFDLAVSILKTEYTRAELNILEVCRRAGISSSYFRKLFFEKYGITPIRYLNEIRIDNAQKMLNSSYCSVENAALKSGFSDYRYFSRVTKKLRGCTPGKLRNL